MSMRIRIRMPMYVSIHMCIVYTCPCTCLSTCPMMSPPGGAIFRLCLPAVRSEIPLYHDAVVLAVGCAHRRMYTALLDELQVIEEEVLCHTIHMSIRMSVYMSVYMSVCMSIHMSMRMCMRMPTRM